jgi:hypothetical protein
MAYANARLVLALRETARRLEAPGIVYRWSHFAHCNCGHLAQTLTRRSAASIYEAAFHRPGDWGDQAAAIARLGPSIDYADRPALDEGAWEPEDVGRCNVTGSPLGAILDEMYAAGLDHDDIRHLERLSDSDVLRRLGKNTTGLPHGDRASVILYLEAWAELLESKLSDDERASLVRSSSVDYDELPLAAE